MVQSQKRFVGRNDWSRLRGKKFAKYLEYYIMMLSALDLSNEYTNYYYMNGTPEDVHGFYLTPQKCFSK